MPTIAEILGKDIPKGTQKTEVPNQEKKQEAGKGKDEFGVLYSEYPTTCGCEGGTPCRIGLSQIGLKPEQNPHDAEQPFYCYEHSETF
ncbi:MAG: hypothetical protein JWM20_231 [Patescibacteria group bacterium]|nr:hypothetical protein [Patescibacteria group bacterium]